MVLGRRFSAWSLAANLGGQGLMIIGGWFALSQNPTAWSGQFLIGLGLALGSISLIGWMRQPRWSADIKDAEANGAGVIRPLVLSIFLGLTGVVALLSALGSLQSELESVLKARLYLIASGIWAGAYIPGLWFARTFWRRIAPYLHQTE